VTRRLALLLLFVASACGGADEASSKDDPIVCEMGAAVPPGFSALDTFEETYPDHVGVRVGFRDEDRREFHVLVGIPGEFGEGMTSAGDLALTGGRTGRLYAGIEGVWVVVWQEDDPCDPRAVIGNGFSRGAFLEALADAGLLAGGAVSGDR
jgi:hypothetical protein